MHLVHVVKYLWHWPGPVGELVVEGSCQLVSPLLDRRAIIPGSSVLFSGAALSFLTAQQNLLQLLLLPLLLQAPQGAQHQSRLALDGWSDRGERKYTFKLTLAHWVSEEWAQRAASLHYLMVTVTSRILSVVMSPVMWCRTAVRVRMLGAELLGVS